MDRGLRFSRHDLPRYPSVALVDAGVNRRTPSGLVIGPAERVSPYEALRAVTAHAAWQIKEEKTKGTLEVGKLADLVILERNPLTVDPATIKDIAVLETIKEGRTIFRRESDGARSQAMAGGSSLPCLHDHDHGAPPALSASARGTLQLLVRAAQR